MKWFILIPGVVLISFPAYLVGITWRFIKAGFETGVEGVGLE